MTEERENKNTDFLFMQERIKQKRIYQSRAVQRLAWSAASGALFGLTALIVLLIFLPRIDRPAERQEVQPIMIPEEDEQEQEQQTVPEEPPVYITETISMELEDYKKTYQQLMQISNQVEKSMVNVYALMVDTDWFDETYTSQKSASGMLIGDNGVEILILTNFAQIGNAEKLQVTFFDRTTAQAVMKKYDKNTGLAVVSVNLSDVAESTREIILYAELGSSKTLRSGEPIIAVGSPVGNYGSVLFGNLTSVSQMAGLYDGTYNVLTTDMAKASSGSGVLVNWSGKIIGLIQNQCEVNGQKGTIQAYGISDIKSVIEHLSGNQDIVYMGIVGADVTTAISEAEGIPIGVFVSEVELDSPAIEAGIQPGDIIVSMSGQPITNLKDVMTILLKCSNGQNVQVVCQRPDKNGYQELELSVNLGILE